MRESCLRARLPVYHEAARPNDAEQGAAPDTVLMLSMHKGQQWIER
jgi:hypothetical protein